MAPRRSVFLAVVLASGAARAQETGARKEHTYALTVEAVHLLSPFFEMELEVSISDLVGIAAIGGAGKVRVTGAAGEEKFSAYEFGGQLNYYAIGTFDKGLMLTAEAVYLKVESDVTGGVAAGLAVGPMFGYKIALRSGFTFMGQAGVSYLAVVSNDVEDVELDNSIVCNRCVANLNLNVGWSF